MADISAMLTSKSNEWETPQDLYDKLDEEFHFNLDPCSTDKNHKCKNYFTIKDDGLSKYWFVEGGARVFVNPPYGKEIKKWVKKCYEESKKEYVDVIVMLIPARTETKYFHDYIYHKAEIRFIKGRIKFCIDGKPVIWNAPFPSMVVIYRNNKNI